MLAAVFSVTDEGQDYYVFEQIDIPPAFASMLA